MEVKSITLDNFRNLRHLELDLSPRTTFILGNNGQGKTNIVEGIYFAIRNRSFRVPYRESLILDGEDFLKARSDILDQGRSLDTEVLLQRTGESYFKVNSKALRSFQSLLTLFPTVVFQPEDLILVKGSPSVRRELLDELIVMQGKKSSGNVLLFERVLQQRNSLLKQAHGKLSQDVQDTLSVWDDRLSTTGEDLASLRENVLAELSSWLVEAYSIIAKESLDLTLKYRRSWSGDLLEALNRSHAADLQRGSTTLGPHRDELDFLIGGKVARYHASQGEARAIAVAIRLAMILYLQQKLGTIPVVFLDDVTSELDEERVKRLFDSIPKAQVLVTGTILPKDFDVDRVLRVEQGRIKAAI